MGGQHNRDVQHNYDVWIYGYIYIYIYTYLLINNTYIYVCLCTYTYMCVYVHIHICIYIYKHIYTYVYIYIYIDISSTSFFSGHFLSSSFRHRQGSWPTRPLTAWRWPWTSCRRASAIGVPTAPRPWTLPRAGVALSKDILDKDIR